MTTTFESFPITEPSVPNRPSARSSPKRFRKFVGLVHGKTKRRLQIFDSLRTLDMDPVSHQEARRQFRNHLIQYTVAEERPYVGLEPVLWFVSLPLQLLVFAAPVLINLQFKASYSLRGWIGIYTLFWVMFVLVGSIAFWPAVRGVKLFSNNLKKRLRLLFRSYAWVMAVTILYSFFFTELVLQARKGQTGPIQHVVMASLLAYFCMFAAVTLPTLISWIDFYVNNRRIHTRCPDTVVIIGLFNLLYILEEREEQWTELDFKRDFMHRMEQIAMRIEHDLPRRLHSDDDRTDVWFARTAMGMAAALREKKKILLNPGPDAREQLRESLKNYFLCALMNNWDGVEKAEPGQLPKKQFLPLMVDYLQTITRGAMPLMIVWVFQKTQLGLRDSMVTDYAWLAALAWLVLSLLIKIDPLSMDKLDALSQLKDLFKKQA